MFLNLKNFVFAQFASTYKIDGKAEKKKTEILNNK